MSSESGLELAAKFGNLATATARGKRRTVEEASFAVKGVFLTGPPSVGVSKNGRLRWNARYDVRGGTNAKGLVSYTGNLQWIQGGTRPHRITPKKAMGTRAQRSDPANPVRISSRKKSGARALKFDGRYAASASHPGTRARPFFGGVKRASGPVANTIVRENLRSNIVKAGFGR